MYSASIVGSVPRLEKTAVVIDQLRRGGAS